MKRIRIFTLLLLLSAAFYACSKENGPDPDNDPDDDSPGVDEFFRMQVDGQLWEVTQDGDVGAAVANFGSGPKLSLAATRMSDSSHCFMGMRYFQPSDTVLTSTGSNALGFQLHYSGSVYVDCAGSLSIQRTQLSGMQVYDGTFSMLFAEGFGGNDTLTLSNGSFKIVRLI